MGTNTWSQDIDAVAGNELDDDNVMYVLHFYAGTHKASLRSKLESALNAGVPVFVSDGVFVMLRETAALIMIRHKAGWIC